jgi:predicted MFS family arabinose efflux permease
MDTAPSAHPATGRPEWRVIAPLCLTVFVILVHGSALSPLAAEVADDLDTSVALVGQVVTLVLAGMGLAALVVGPLADQIGHRRTIVLGLLTLLASAFAMGLAPSLWVMLLSGLLAGAGASIIGVPFAIAATRWSGDVRLRALSRVQSAQTLGSILGAPLLTAVAAATIWRGAYVVIIAAYVVAILLVLRGVAPDRRPEPGRFSTQTVLDAYRPLASDGSMRQLYASSAARGIGWFGPLIYLGAFYTDVHDLSLRQVGLAYMVASVGLFLGNLAAGEWLARFDLRRTCALTTTILGAGLLATFTLPLSALPTVALVTVTTFCAGVGWVNLTTLMAANTAAGPGTTMTLNVSIYTLSSAASVAVAGALISLGGYTLLGVAFPAFLALSALLVWAPARAPAAALESGQPS